MSAATALALEKAPRRNSPRYPVSVALDVVALRSGVPENLPGRSLNLSEGGVAGMVAGELTAGQQVGIDLKLPSFGMPLRARAVVRHRGKLRYGFEFFGLTVEQQEMIRYWAYRIRHQTAELEEKKNDPVKIDSFAAAPPLKSRFRIGRRRFDMLLAAMLLVGGAGWWQWQRSWSELEVGAKAAEEAPLRVSPETMQMRIVSKVEPEYPEEARRSGKQGLAVLDVVVAPDGTVQRLRPVWGDDLMLKSAAAAVGSWKFEPYLSSGRAIPVETTIAVEFKLN